jgi:KaiC/GvpD/RAD55 family RecA-like ATPase
MVEPFEIARRLRDEFGMSVIPIGSDKKPLVRWQTFQETKPTDENLTAWFVNGGRRNVGIVTGRISGVVVVDTDSEAAEAWAIEHLPATPMMCQTAKGMHRYYRHPGVEVRNGARIKTVDGVIELDVRGDGGYVVGPGSTHPTGITYRPPQKWPSLGEVPVFDPTWLQSAPARTIATQEGASGSEIPNGRRNSALASLAGSMRRRGMTADSIEAALLAENSARCSPPLSDDEVQEIARSIGRYDPETPDSAPVRALDFVTLTELLDRPDPQYLVSGRIVAGSLVTLYGPSGVGKTFVALDLAFSVAASLDWLGAPTLLSGPVAYVVAEGAGGVPKRARSWLRARNVIEPPDVRVLCQPVLLNEPQEARALLDALRSIRPVLIVIDTMARCSTGDENSVQDAMTLVRNCDRIRQEIGATVLLVHHTGVNENRERGSSALRGACDAMIALSDDGDTLKLRFDKQKDDETPADLRIALVSVPDTNSCVVRLATTGSLSARFTPSHRQALDALERLFTAKGATASEWLTASQMKERTFYSSRKWLVEWGYVREDHNRYVRTDKAAE